ncbi:hypothetical protein [Streptomyces sp. 1331.2]|uniref:hypothetical protein n=1 Tax=Streptomyces sp. 1331.2 TaxID=1938835 RepID=UPI000BD416BB|nr:hypothetical protein [Streptomyces sp. 1331.2]SOB84223.1 hypothetical protein SAMN06272789_4468 [Streptomyces sp. 1331.2]
MTGRLLVGGGVLLQRVTDWTARDGVKSGIARGIGITSGAAFGGGFLLAAPGLWWPTAGTWLLASWIAAKNADRQTGEEETEETEDELDHGAFIASLHLFIGAEKGAHLAQLAAGLLGDETATDRIREMCDAANVPITRGVRVKNRGVSTGIRRDQLPPLPPHILQPLANRVAAGQSEQQQQQHAPEEGAREGFWIKDDPENPARSAVHWIKEKTS